MSKRFDIRPNKVIRYSDKDPRFNLTIQDSDEYTRQILPFGMKVKCRRSSDRIFRDSDENYVEPNDPDFNGILIKNFDDRSIRVGLRTGERYPSKRALACGSERYENCIRSSLDKEYDKCELKIEYDDD